MILKWVHWGGKPTPWDSVLWQTRRFTAGKAWALSPGVPITYFWKTTLFLVSVKLEFGLTQATTLPLTATLWVISKKDQPSKQVITKSTSWLEFLCALFIRKLNALAWWLKTMWWQVLHGQEWLFQAQTAETKVESTGTTLLIRLNSWTSALELLCILIRMNHLKPEIMDV